MFNDEGFIGFKGFSQPPPCARVVGFFLVRLSKNGKTNILVKLG
jgi:hypothetical protein